MGIHTYLCFSLLADDKKTSLPATGWGILVFFGEERGTPGTDEGWTNRKLRSPNHR